MGTFLSGDKPVPSPNQPDPPGIPTRQKLPSQRKIMGRSLLRRVRGSLHSPIPVNYRFGVPGEIGPGPMTNGDENLRAEGWDLCHNRLIKNKNRKSERRINGFNASVNARPKPTIGAIKPRARAVLWA